jgi:hypothetical protein
MMHYKYDFTYSSGTTFRHQATTSGGNVCSNDGYYYNTQGSTIIDHVFVYGFMYAVIGGSYYNNVWGWPCYTYNTNSVSYGNYHVWKITGTPSALTLTPYRDFFP